MALGFRETLHSIQQETRLRRVAHPLAFGASKGAEVDSSFPSKPGADVVFPLRFCLEEAAPREKRSG